MELIENFPSAYTVVLQPDLPGQGAAVHDFFRKSPTEPTGVLLLVNDGIQRWFGAFRNGYDSPPAMSVASTTPNPDVLCVVAAGAGYWVNVRKPDEYLVMEPFPLLGYYVRPNIGLIFFCGFTRIAAYGAGGLLYTTNPLVSDSLRVISATDDQIAYEGWDAPNQRNKSGKIDARTGMTLA